MRILTSDNTPTMNSFENANQIETCVAELQTSFRRDITTHPKQREPRAKL